MLTYSMNSRWQQSLTIMKQASILLKIVQCNYSQTSYYTNCLDKSLRGTKEDHGIYKACKTLNTLQMLFFLSSYEIISDIDRCYSIKQSTSMH